MNELAVSSYSLRDLLGSIRIWRRGPDGTKQPLSLSDRPGTLSLLQLPGEVKRRVGVALLEICQFHVPERSDRYLAELRGALAAAGTRVVNMPIDAGNVSDANEQYREEDLADIEGWIRFAARLGSRMVRVNASGLRAQDPAPLEVTIASFRRLADTARANGVQLLVENHGGISDDFATIVRIVEGVGRGDLKTCVDIANHPALAPANRAARDGNPPAEIDASPLYDDLRLIAPMAGILHAKTAAPLADGRPSFDVARALGVVRDVGFKGPISLELGPYSGDPWDALVAQRRVVESVFG